MPFKAFKRKMFPVEPRELTAIFESGMCKDILGPKAFRAKNWDRCEDNCYTNKGKEIGWGKNLSWVQYMYNLMELTWDILYPWWCSHSLSHPVCDLKYKLACSFQILDWIIFNIPHCVRIAQLQLNCIILGSNTAMQDVVCKCHGLKGAATMLEWAGHYTCPKQSCVFS